MGNKIKKIIFASHPLREYASYAPNWFSSLLYKFVEFTTGLPIEFLVPPSFASLKLEDNHIPFDYIKFCEFYGLNYTKQTWGELFYNKEYNKEAYDYVESIFKDSLVISYEMDACILNILDNLQIPYIDMYLSPIRFLEDQLFSITSNFSEIYNKILEYRLPEETIYLQAEYLKTFYLMRDFEKMQKTPTVLFLGQTMFDRSLINPKTGEIYSILNHKEEFERSIQGYNNIFYKRHPKVNNDLLIVDYLKSLGNVHITTDNFYSLISDHNIKKVIAISSGGVTEAKYFGKETQHLLHSSVNLQYGTDFDREKYINVYEHFFALHFWADILSPIINTKDFPNKIGFYGSKNRLRNSRGHRDYWGYEDLDHEMVKAECLNLQQLMPSSVYVQKIRKILYHLTYNKRFLKS